MCGAGAGARCQPTWAPSFSTAGKFMQALTRSARTVGSALIRCAACLQVLAAPPVCRSFARPKHCTPALRAGPSLAASIFPTFAGSSRAASARVTAAAAPQTAQGVDPEEIQW